MRSGFLGWLMAAVVLPGVAAASDGAAAAAGVSAANGVYDLKLVPLGHEVFLLQRPDPFRQPVEPNALFIVNAADVVVVDSGGSALAAENAIRHIRSVTRKPVSVVINTHWHGDHNLGNAVYRREFPGVRIAAHRNTQRDIAGPPMDYVKRYPKMLADYLAQAKGDTTDIQAMAAEFGRAEVSPPDWLFDTELTLLRGTRTIQLLHLGRGNTEGDVVVWLPEERILASGDLVVAPIPYGFGSFPEQWLATLDRLKAFDFQVLVPGHGEVMHDRAHIEVVQAMLRSARAKARVAVAAGSDLAKFKESLDFTPFARGLVGDDARSLSLFKAWWSDPIARSAWLEARGEPIKQGASDETG
jgi:glyoxylase-like metal-dependent hydrolase (beta-lactamase superfamily II)